eukprot:3151409-Pyramimonas_sp.AAC.1
MAAKKPKYSKPFVVVGQEGLPPLTGEKRGTEGYLVPVSDLAALTSEIPISQGELLREGSKCLRPE